MKKALVAHLMGSPTTLGVVLCFVATWLTLERIETKIDKIKNGLGYRFGSNYFN